MITSIRIRKIIYIVIFLLFTDLFAQEQQRYYAYLPIVTGVPAYAVPPEQPPPPGQPPVVGEPPVFRPSPFAVQVHTGSLISEPFRTSATELGVNWVRLDGVLWHEIQPEPDGPYRWSALAGLEREIDAARELGLTPVVIIRGAPLWAAVAPAFCAAVRDERLPEYAAFLEALAQRYRGRVNYWELGNEPDVDPRLVAADSPFGCMGDIDDPYYGGERYGRMLQVAAPALRRGNPDAGVVFGGLLLATSHTTDPSRGRPERFLEGALRAGAAPYFDILAYHSHVPYIQRPDDDHDTSVFSLWSDLGGWTVGKARFLREVMARFEVNKPLWLNETSLTCDSRFPPCHEPPATFLEVQAQHLTRIYTRAIAFDIEQIAWYSLDRGGWEQTGLLNTDHTPRPVYHALQHMARTVQPFQRAYQIYSEGDLEGYRFVKETTVVDILWTRQGGLVRGVYLPAERLVVVSRYDGTTVAPHVVAGMAYITASFEPVLVEWAPGNS